MIKIFLGVFLLVCCADTVAQSGNYSRKFPDRYALHLPKEWNKPKILKVLTEILPQAIDELKDLDFCTDCEGRYTVMLVIDSPLIKSRNNTSNGSGGNVSYYTMEVIYQFRAAIGIIDSSGKIITELVLVSDEEEHAKRSASQYTQTTYSLQSIKDREGRITRMMIPISRPAPLSNQLSPTMTDLINIAEQRIYLIRDFLKNSK
jgi:hypothetical protein